MNRRVFASLITVATAFAAETPKPAVPDRLAPGFNAIREESLRADVTFLASDALDGRLSLQPGDTVAAEWVASEFAKAGLQPVVEGGYFQPVPVIEFTADRMGNHLALAR